MVKGRERWCAQPQWYATVKGVPERRRSLPLPALLRRAWAERRRRLGLYDEATLAAYAAAHARTSAPADLLAWALFRRDLGHALPQRWVAPLAGSLAGLAPSQRRLALGLLAEVAPPSVLEAVPSAWRVDAAARLPALACRYVASAPGTTGALTRIDAQQEAWRFEFAQWLARCRADGGVAVIGNAAGLRGSGLGSAIDALAGVVRFNDFGAGNEMLAADVGHRIDAWVVAPDYRGPAPPQVRWVVVSGPDMRYRLQDWSAVQPCLAAGTPVLTVPLASWRVLVNQLRAPPSAGLLMLRWLADLQPNAPWDGLFVAGIGSGLGVDGRYHAATGRHRPTSRHDWVGEAALMRRWQAQGLTLWTLAAPR